MSSNIIIHHRSNAYDFLILIFAKLLSLLLLLQSLQNCYCYCLCYYCYCYYCYQNYHTTVLLNTLLQIFSSLGVVELTTQLLILTNILWLFLCRINKFGLNTLPSKTVAIPYTCGLSRPFSGAVAEEHSYICCVTWNYYQLIIMKNLKDNRTKIVPSKMRGGKELPSSSALDSPSVLRKLATPSPAITSDMSQVIDDAT